MVAIYKTSYDYSTGRGSAPQIRKANFKSYGYFHGSRAQNNDHKMLCQCQPKRRNFEIELPNIRGEKFLSSS
jgi:hypothetical protein